MCKSYWTRPVLSADARRYWLVESALVEAMSYTTKGENKTHNLGTQRRLASHTLRGTALWFDRVFLISSLHLLFKLVASSGRLWGFAARRFAPFAALALFMPYLRLFIFSPSAAPFSAGISLRVASAYSTSSFNPKFHWFYSP